MDWKEKLEQPEQLPEFTMTGRQAAWEQLYLRLGKKPASKKIFFRIAAASMLIFISLLFLVPAGKKTQLGITFNPLITQKETPQSKVHFAAVQPAQILQPKQPKNFIKPPVSNKKNTILQAASSSEKDSSGVIAANEIIRADSTVASLPSTDSPATYSAVKEKKRLRIIHINELGVPDEEEIGLMNVPDKRSFRFSFGNQEVFDNRVPVNDHHKKGLLRIRISSQN
jgi:hypothetical protein